MKEGYMNKKVNEKSDKMIHYKPKKTLKKQTNRKISARMKRKIIRKLIQKIFSVLIILLLLFIIFKIATSNHTSETTAEGTSKENTILEEDSQSNGNDLSRNSNMNLLDRENDENSGNTGNQSDPFIINNDWRLTLANYENIIPENFEIELANIDEERQFDARAIQYLNQMMEDMRNDGITNIWIQSAYRSVKKQKELYNNSINKYLKQGKTQEEAEKLTLEYINKPGASDHNLGLAVDFNYVDESFEDLKGFEWLQQNAEKYGFVLRYPKDKEKITKIKYEPWHWRFVGQEHAKKMNELNMCLEEYVDYLANFGDGP